MATVVRLRVCPESFDYLCFRGHHSRRSLRRGFCWSSSRMILGGGHDGLRLNRCWALKSENGGHLEEKRSESEGEDQILVNLNREKGFWVSMKSIMLKTFKANPKSDDEYRQAVAKVEEVLSSVALQIGRYIVTMMSTGVILTIGFLMSGGESQMEGLIWYSWLGGIIIGTMIGANMVLEEHCRAGPRNVIITGSTRGLGKALAREFLLSGDRVVVTSRRWCLDCSPESVQATVEELEESLKEGIASGVGSSLTKLSHAKVVGIACDVCEPRDVQRLANFAVSELGCIDIWINNAGANKGFRPLLQFSDEDIRQIVSTNLVGSIICTREAIRIMNNQPNGGRIFNMDGAGSGGSSTPLTAVYGSTKCGLRQLQGSLLKECKRSKVGVHSASPGMVLTDLLLRGEPCMLLRQIDFGTGLKTELVFQSLMPWKCTQRTRGYQSSHFLLFVPS
ncbi:probable chlorophyll(ide) b reductase NYC1, chloroplastic isoform X2 [Neltuma alba]|uniref:probable chlorophyll(ide) b reductase NYC1, chloroplastic isoform X2 n=1 Tax=Neltuma alba TaxID=207710 RepID=UPI0010A55008|nr:probable chlorophyll(ide) b reductase NYC1, chloroplastic isoform X2 [Prosopis alba]